MDIEQEIKLQEITQIICDYFNVTKEDLMTNSRKNEHVIPRSFIFRIMRDVYGKNISLKTLGAVFNRDHATVLNSIQKNEELLETNTKYRLKYAEFISIQSENDMTVYKLKEDIKKALQMGTVNEIKDHFSNLLQTNSSCI
jgi:Bacterial dnaA protein helix-turn-helix